MVFLFCVHVCQTQDKNIRIIEFTFFFCFEKVVPVSMDVSSNTLVQCVLILVLLSYLYFNAINFITGEIVVH
jgi:hypothetical protein